jgi:hypothetical protein
VGLGGSVVGRSDFVKMGGFVVKRGDFVVKWGGFVRVVVV